MDWKKVIKATRAHRAIMPLSAMLIPAAFADKINTDVFILSIVCILTYSGSAIHNAIRDNDYRLPNYAHYLIYIFPGLAFILAYANPIILFTLITWILLGVAYNTIARRVIFGDITLLGVTHLAIPIISSSLLLGYPLQESMFLAAYIYVLFIFMGNMKNIKDAESDKERGYMTINTITKKGEKMTKSFAIISWVMMLFTFFIFDLSYSFLIMFAGITLLIIYSFSIREKAEGFHLFKLAFIAFLFSIIIDKTNNFAIVATGAAYCIVYLMPAIARQIADNKTKKEGDINGRGERV